MARAMVSKSRICKRAVGSIALACVLSLVPAHDLVAQVPLAPGDVLLADLWRSVKGAAMRVDPVTGERTSLTGVDPFEVDGGARGIALEPGSGGSVLVLISGYFGGGWVIRIDPETGSQMIVSADGMLDGVGGIAVEADGSILVADSQASGGAGAVIHVNPAMGAQTTVSSGGVFVDPFGVAVEADGNIVVADAMGQGSGTGAVIRVDPTTGTQTIVSQGGLFVDAVGIAVEANGTILVADPTAFSDSTTDTGGIFRVDPATGTQTILAQGAGRDEPTHQSARPHRGPA